MYKEKKKERKQEGEKTADKKDNRVMSPFVFYSCCVEWGRGAGDV